VSRIDATVGDTEAGLRQGPILCTKAGREEHGHLSRRLVKYEKEEGLCKPGVEDRGGARPRFSRIQKLQAVASFKKGKVVLHLAIGDFGGLGKPNGERISRGPLLKRSVKLDGQGKVWAPEGTGTNSIEPPLWTEPLSEA